MIIVGDEYPYALNNSAVGSVMKGVLTLGGTANTFGPLPAVFCRSVTINGCPELLAISRQVTSKSPLSFSSIAVTQTSLFTQPRVESLIAMTSIRSNNECLTPRVNLIGSARINV